MGYGGKLLNHFFITRRGCTYKFLMYLCERVIFFIELEFLTKRCEIFFFFLDEFGEWRFSEFFPYITLHLSLTFITYIHHVHSSLTFITYIHHLHSSLTYFGFSRYIIHSKSFRLTYYGFSALTYFLLYHHLPTLDFQHV